MKRSIAISLILAIFVWIPLMVQADDLKGNTIFSDIKQILTNPQAFEGTFVSVKAKFFGWRGASAPPPVSKSDWLAKSDDGLTIYCSGNFPKGFSPNDQSCLGKSINILGKVVITGQGAPYIEIFEALPLVEKPEQMVSVAQILFDPLWMRGQKVGLLGVLAKGFGPRGNRIYFLADPTGAITIQRLPKLYPTGTILRLKGIVANDSDGLPQLKNVEIVFAKN